MRLSLEFFFTADITVYPTVNAEVKALIDNVGRTNVDALDTLEAVKRGLRRGGVSLGETVTRGLGMQSNVI